MSNTYLSLSFVFRRFDLLPIKNKSNMRHIIKYRFAFFYAVLLLSMNALSYDYPVIGTSSSSDGNISPDGKFRVSWTVLYSNQYIYFQWKQNGGNWTSIGETTYVDFDLPNGTYQTSMRVCQPGYCSPSKTRTVTVEILDSLTVKYKYDALGRVTFVYDNLNGNRDYEYDKAGNRKRVDVGVASEDSNANQPGGENSLPPPTGLVYGGPYSYNFYRFQWDENSDADYYKVIFNDDPNWGDSHNTPVPYLDAKTFPISVQLCSNVHGCGEKAYY